MAGLNAAAAELSFLARKIDKLFGLDVRSARGDLDLGTFRANTGTELCRIGDLLDALGVMSASQDRCMFARGEIVNPPTELLRVSQSASTRSPSCSHSSLRLGRPFSSPPSTLSASRERVRDLRCVDSDGFATPMLLLVLRA